MDSELGIKRNVMIVAGEASGDIYGAQVAKETMRRAPCVRFFGIGGSHMREAGVDTLVDSADMAVVGFVEVLRHFDVIANAFLKLRKILLTTPPDLLVLIDYPGFNLRLASVARKAGVKVLYYISPQIWAWRQGRIKKIARLVDHMAVIFPFEVSYYQQAGVPVSFVGHPMYDMVVVNKQRSEAAASFGLDPSRKIIGLFPGSRRSEIRLLLPVIVEAATLLRKRFPDAQFVLPLASTLCEGDISPKLRERGLDVVITHKRIHDLIQACDAVICVSGTVTLEIALVGTPMVVIYKLSPLTYWIARLLVHVNNIAICNIVAGETVVRELIQEQANPRMISEEIFLILENNSYRDSMKRKLATIREKLQCGGASRNIAELILQLTGLS